MPASPPEPLTYVRLFPRAENRLTAQSEWARREVPSSPRRVLIAPMTDQSTTLVTTTTQMDISRILPQLSKLTPDL